MLESNFLTTIVLPVYLMVVMAGLGMSLVPADFSRLLTHPRAAIVGLAGQLILVPGLAFGFAWLFVDDPMLAVGFVILGACPGGITSNLCVHLARGDTALSVTLTAVSSLCAMVTVPLYVGLALHLFIDVHTTIEMPIVKTVVQIFALTVVPICLGMYLRSRRPDSYQGIEWILEIMLAFFLVLLVLIIVLMEWRILSDSFMEIGGLLIAMNLAMLTMGYLISLLSGLDARQRTAVTIELGIQNGTLGIVVAITILDTVSFAIPSGLYALLMLFTAAAVIGVAGRSNRAQAASEAES